MAHVQDSSSLDEYVSTMPGYQLPAFRAAKPPRFIEQSSPVKMKAILTHLKSAQHFGRSNIKDWKSRSREEHDSSGSSSMAASNNAYKVNLSPSNNQDISYCIDNSSQEKPNISNETTTVDPPPETGSGSAQSSSTGRLRQSQVHDKEPQDENTIDRHHRRLTHKKRNSSINCTVKNSISKSLNASRRSRFSRGSEELVSVTVDGLVEELRDFFLYALEMKRTSSGNFKEQRDNQDSIADTMQLEIVKYHPTVLTNARLLWDTSQRQYGHGFDYTTYIFICRKLLMVIVGSKTLKKVGRRDVFEKLIEEWKIDSDINQHILTFEQFLNIMHQMIDTWAPEISSDEKVEWFDEITGKILCIDAIGNTSFVRDSTVDHGHERLYLQKVNRKDQLIHWDKKSTAYSLLARPMSLHHGYPASTGSLIKGNETKKPENDSYLPQSNFRSTTRTPKTASGNRVTTQIHLPTTDSDNVTGDDMRTLSYTAGSLFSATSQHNYDSFSSSDHFLRSMPATNRHVENMPDSRATSAARAWTRESIRSQTKSQDNNTDGKVSCGTHRKPAKRANIDGRRSSRATRSKKDALSEKSFLPILEDDIRNSVTLFQEEGQLDTKLAEASMSKFCFPSSDSYLSDSVNIRSCILLGRPQPFGTWNGQYITAPEGIELTEKWFESFNLHKNKDNTKPQTKMAKNIQSVSKFVKESKRPMASSREFRFSTSKARSTRFAKVTTDRLRAHTRHCRQDQGFSLWMRGAVAGYYRDRADFKLKQLSTKAGDLQLLINKEYRKLDDPGKILLQSHATVNDRISENSKISTQIERENGRWWWTGNGRRYGVSRILNQSSANLATQPPPKPWPISQPVVKSDIPLSPPPVIDSSSTFRPICEIQSSEIPGKYWRRKLLPIDVLDPPANSVAGAQVDPHLVSRAGQEGSAEAMAVQAALDSAERVKAEKKRRLRLASRGRW